jgi:hypothetical protein
MTGTGPGGNGSTAIAAAACGGAVVEVRRAGTGWRVTRTAGAFGSVLSLADTLRKGAAWLIGFE